MIVTCPVCEGTPRRRWRGEPFLPPTESLCSDHRDLGEAVERLRSWNRVVFDRAAEVKAAAARRAAEKTERQSAKAAKGML